MKRTLLVALVVGISVGFVVVVPNAPPGEAPRNKAPGAGTVVFAAGGDHTNNSIFQTGLNNLKASGAEFYVAVGDLGFTGVGNERTWCENIKAKMGSSYPFQLLSGNHDEDGSGDGRITNYVQWCLDRMNSVGTYGAQYYFDYPSVSPLVRVILLTAGITTFGTYRGYNVGSPEYTWASNTIDAARTNGIPWVVVANHKVCITTGGKSCEAGTDLYNLLINKKVDLILHGHVHTNERSKQLSCVTVNSYNPACVVDDGSDNLYTKGAGPVIIIGGPMGQGTRTPNLADPEAGYFAKLEGGTYGFYKYTVTADRIDAVYNKIQGSHTDSFSIVANTGPDTTPPVIGTVSATPSPQTSGLSVKIAASVSDNQAIGGVWVHVTDPLGADVGNFSMAYISASGKYEYSRSYAVGGTYSFVVWAKDSSNNWASKSGNFVMVDPVPDCSGSTGPSTGFIGTQGSDLYLDGARVRFVGGNSYGIFSEYLGAGHVTDLVPNALQRFQEAKDTKLKIIRFWLDIAPSDYWWTKSYGVYKSQSDHATYFSAFDALLADAKANGIKIIPVFASAFDQWTKEGGNTNFWIVGSQSNLLFKDFVNEVVTRYKNEPQIAWWELSNEPNYFSTIWMSRATHSELVAWAQDLAAFIRSIDSNHLIEGGYNNMGNFDMAKFDELNSFLDIASHHIYDVDLYALEAGKGITDRYTAVNDYVQTFTDRAKINLGLPLLWGEFGADMNAEPTTLFHDWLLEAIYNRNSDAALMWSWEEGYTSDPHVVSLTYRPHVAPELARWSNMMSGSAPGPMAPGASADTCPPAVKNVKLNGVAGDLTVMPGTPVWVNATLDDTSLGGLNISSANFTIGVKNWVTSIGMNAVDGSFNSPIENVTSAMLFIDTGTLGAGAHQICVYGSDELLNKNLTGACRLLTVIGDTQEPMVLGFTINGATALSVLQSSPPANLFLQATIDDSGRGNSDIAAANFTLNGDWSGATPMDASDGTFNWITETVQKTIPVPSAPGSYRYCVYGKDLSNNLNTTGQCVTVTVIDNVAPGVTASDTPDPQQTGGIVQFAATATDNIGVSAVFIDIKDPGGGPVGNYSMAFDAPSGKWLHSQAFTPLGIYSYKVSAKDAANNFGFAQGTFEIVSVPVPPDTTPPTVTVMDNPDPQQTGGTVQFAATATDDVDVSAVFIEIKDPSGSPVGNYSMFFNAGSGEWLHGQAFTPLGIYSYKVSARDPSGNFGFALGTFEVVPVPVPPDTTPPIVSVADNPDPQQTGGAVQFSATATDDNGVSAVFIDIKDPSGGPVGNYSMAFDAPSGMWQHSQAFTLLGIHSYKVSARDAADNFGFASGTFEVVSIPVPPDTTPPTVTVTDSPDPQQANRTVYINATVTDDVSVDTVSVNITNVGNLSMTYNAATGKWVLSRAFPAPRLYTYAVWAADGAGNWGTASGSVRIMRSVHAVTVKGKVVKIHSEEPIPGATIRVIDASGQVVATSTSASDGGYSITGIEIGSYIIEFAKDGYVKTSTTVVLSPVDVNDFGVTYMSPFGGFGAADWSVWSLMGVLMGICAILVLFSVKRRRKKEDKTGKATETEDDQQD